jgi:hypothetical protein
MPQKSVVAMQEQLRRSAPCLLPERGCQRVRRRLTPADHPLGAGNPVIAYDSYSGYTGRKLAQRSARSDFCP